MASVVVPILAGLEPVIAPLIIKIIDKVFPPKSGSVKFPTAQAIFQAILDGLAKTGQPVAIPDQPTLAGWIQELVNELNKAGALKGPATVIPTAAGNLDTIAAFVNWLKTSPIPIGGG